MTRDEKDKSFLKRKRKPRPDREGPQRQVYERNRKRIFAMYNTCALCGRPVDFSLKYPDPMSATIDHIVPISLGGSPIDLENLQLAHSACNVKKSAKLMDSKKGGEYSKEQQTLSNRLLPHSVDWFNFNEK